MRLFALTVGRNEASRYLALMLSRCSDFDGHFFYDDHSHDDTVQIAAEHGCVVAIRDATVPPFLKHEGRFRQAAWNEFERLCRPELGDWVLAIDCDELIVAEGQVGSCMEGLATKAAEKGLAGVLMPVPEVFGYRGATPLVRTDGFWGQIAGPRFFQYLPGGRFKDKAMGSGSEPTYVAEGGRFLRQEEVFVLHLGYATEADRRAKYARYSQMAHGHADAHIQSILKKPTLAAWKGPR